MIELNVAAKKESMWEPVNSPAEFTQALSEGRVIVVGNALGFGLDDCQPLHPGRIYTDTQIQKYLNQYKLFKHKEKKYTLWQVFRHEPTKNVFLHQARTLKEFAMFIPANSTPISEKNFTY